MKKVIVLLICASLMCVGCGDASTNKDATESAVNGTVKDEAVAEKSAETKKPVKNKKSDQNAEPSTPVSDQQPAHEAEESADNVFDCCSEDGQGELITDGFIPHRNAERTGDFLYLPMQYSKRDDVISAVFNPYDFGKYESYTDQWVFDSLVKEPEDGLTLEETNFKIIAEKVKDAYFEYTGIDPKDKEIVCDEYMDTYSKFWGIYIADPGEIVGNIVDQVGDYIGILHCEEDMPNEVTVHIVRDCKGIDLYHNILLGNSEEEEMPVWEE